MDRKEAIELLKSGARIEWAHRDATLSYWERKPVSLNDAGDDIETYHPTDPKGPRVRVPDRARLRVAEPVDPEWEAEQARWEEEINAGDR